MDVREAAFLSLTRCESGGKYSNLEVDSAIKKYGFTSHGHFSLFCRKFLGDTPRTLRRRSHLGVVTTLEDVKKNLDRARRQSASTKANSAESAEAPRRRGRPRKSETK